MVEAVLFWILAVLIVVTALGVIAFKNPVNSAMSLIGSFFFLAALYVLLRAHLVAALQVLVYAGAIMVLFVFVIMLLSLSDKELGEPKWTFFKWLGIVAAVLIAAFAIFAVSGGSQALAPSPAAGTFAQIAEIIYTDYALAFELIAVLLLVAIVGAVVVAKRRI